MKENIFKTTTVSLNYVSGPDNGEPLLLLHGICGRWQSFSPILPELSKHFHVYALDLRGHGKSSRVDSYKLQDYVNDVATFIKGNIKKPTIIFGNSFGGIVTMMLAANHPELVKAIIVGDSPLTYRMMRTHAESQRDLAHQVIHWLRCNEVSNIYQELKDDHFAESLSLCDPNMLIAMYDSLDTTFEGYRLDQVLPMTHCPILILRGEEDRGSLIPDEDLQYALSLAPTLSHAKLPRTGHSLMEDKALLLQELNDFLNRYKT